MREIVVTLAIAALAILLAIAAHREATKPHDSDDIYEMLAWIDADEENDRRSRRERR